MLGEMRMHGKAKSSQHPPACQNPGYHIGTASLCIDRIKNSRRLAAVCTTSKLILATRAGCLEGLKLL